MKTHTTIRIEKELLDRLRAEAQTQERSVNYLIVKAIKNLLDKPVK